MTYTEFSDRSVETCEACRRGGGGYESLSLFLFYEMLERV